MACSSHLGAVNILGRLTAGMLANIRWVRPLWLCNAAMFLCALCCALFPLCATFPTLCAFSVGFGFFIGNMSSSIISYISVYVF